MDKVVNSIEIPKGYTLDTSKKESKALTNIKPAIQSLENVGKVYPTAEVVASVASQAYGLPLSGLAGAAALPFGLEVSNNVRKAIAKTLIYEPQSLAGKQLAQAAFYPFEKLHEMGESLGDWTLEKTNSPVAASIAATSVEALPIIAAEGFRLRGRSKPAVIPDKLTPESKFIKEQFDSKFLKDEGIKTYNEELKLELSAKDAKFKFINDLNAYPKGKVPLYHETSIKNLDSILKNGLQGDTTFSTVGTPSDFITSPDKLIIKFIGDQKRVSPDMRYVSTEGTRTLEQELYTQHTQLKGSDVSYNDIVPKSAIEEIQIVKNNKVVKTIKQNYRKQRFGSLKDNAKTELTPEETFVLDAEGPEGLKKSGEDRKVVNETLEDNKVVNLDKKSSRVKLAIGVEPTDVIRAGKQILGNTKKVIQRADLEKLRSLGWKWKQASLEQAPELGNRPHKMWRMIEPTKGRKRPVIMEPPKTSSQSAVPSTTLYGGIPLHKFAELYTKHAGEPIWDNLIMTKIPKLLERIPGGKSINRAIMYDYRGDLPDTPLYINSLRQMKRNQNIGRSYAIDVGQRLQQFPERSRRTIGDRIRGKEVSMTKQEAEMATEVRNSLDSLGKQAVDVGLLDEKVFFENVGKYLPRLYTSKEYQSLLQRFNTKMPKRLDMSRFLRRKDIPKEVRQKMGEIIDPTYPTSKGIIQLTHDVELAKHFNGIAENSDWAITKQPVLDTAGKEIPFKYTTYDRLTGKKIIETGVKKEYPSDIPNDWIKLPKDKKLGKLSEAYVHPEIAPDINLAIKIRTKGEKIWRNALGAWKFGKVIMSPKTHIRNLFSNSLLTHMGGTPLWRQPEVLYKSIREMKSKGKYWQRAKEEGILDTTFTEGELRTLFSGVEEALKGASAEDLPGIMGNIGNVWASAKKLGNKASELYNLEEQWFKMAKFIDSVEKRGMNFKEAALDADKWLFNYTELTRAQEAYRSKWYGAPFATFTFKALPRMAEAAIKTPWRFAAPAAMIYALEEAARSKFGDTPETESAKKKLRPEWMQGGIAGMPNFPRVPVEDSSGREYYLNLSYIVPWGDIGESGGFGPIPGGVMPLSQPFTKELWNQIAGSGNFDFSGGYDLFWKEPIVKDSDVAGLDTWDRIKVSGAKRGRHLYNTMVPTLAMDIEKGIDAYRGQPDFRGRERPRSVVAADTFLGLKMYPVDYDEQMLRTVRKLNPGSSNVARKIMSQIRTLSVKRNYILSKGQTKRAKKLDKRIANKVKQLRGLGKKLKEKGKIYKQIPKGYVKEE